MLRYAITDGSAASPEGHARLLEDARRWAADGVDFVQLREPSLEPGALLALATSIAKTLHTTHTKLLINSRPDIAIAANADGVHLTARPGELTPAQVRTVFAAAGATPPLVSVSCHTLAEVTRASQAAADLILFGPIFEKRIHGAVVVQGIGLEALAQASRAAATTPVLALGGLTPQTTPACLSAGAAGIAGIRIFARPSTP